MTYHLQEQNCKQSEAHQAAGQRLQSGNSTVDDVLKLNFASVEMNMSDERRR
mgnify:FL=1